LVTPFFFLSTPTPPSSTLFPYTTLFRSSIASDVDVHGYPSSFAFWLLIPDDDVATIPYWSALITSYQLQVWPAILNCMHSGASFVTCRIAAGGTAPQRFVEAAPANHGAWTGGQAQSVAAGLY